MKKISSRFSIAVHILSLIATSGQACTSEWMAGSVNTNPVIIRRIIGQLKKAGLVTVRAGAGGASLCKTLQEITLLEVYQAVEVVEHGHLFHFHDHPNPACEVGANIEGVLRQSMLRAEAALERELAQTTLEEIVHGVRTKTAY